MATSLHVLRSANRAILSVINRRCLLVANRNLLSSAYSCTESWTKSIASPSFGHLSLSDFAIQIHEQLEKFGRVSSVDMEIFGHQVNQLDGNEEAEFVEDILRRYNHCQDSFPPCPSTCHALVRGYMEAGLGSRLPGLLSDRLTFGLFPNFYTINLLMDHFIKNDHYNQAVRLAYFTTMQEDFSDPINVLLCLEACTKFLTKTDISNLALPPKDESDGEEDWIKVKYIRYPDYDDHFDIKDQRFLHGKTLMMLAQTKAVQIPIDIQTSLRIIGTGMYHKFDDGITFLKEILHSSGLTVSSQSLEYFSKSLQSLESRDVDEPEIEIALRTVDDVIHKMLPSHQEKEQFISDFESVKEKLTSNRKIVDSFSLDDSVNQFVSLNIAHYEQSDISRQSDLFKVWREKRDSELDKQLYELRKGERIEEMKEQIRGLQEQEELLQYFENEENVRLKFIKEDVDQSDPALSISKL